MRGALDRGRLRKEKQAELSKNLSALEKFSQMYLAQKNDLLRLPLPKVIVLVNQLLLLYRLRRDKVPQVSTYAQDATLGTLTRLSMQ